MTPEFSKQISEHLQEIAGYQKHGGMSAKQGIGEAMRRTGFGQSRAFDLWYGKARRIEPAELDAIEDALAKKRREAARNELHDLQIRIARMEARLATTDPDFHRVDLDALREGLGLGRRGVPNRG